MPAILPSIPNEGASPRGHDFRHDDPRQRLIVALDVSTAAAARKIVAAVGDSALTYKVGMQLYTAEGPQLVRDLIASGRRVFLDLKYHDIPNTRSGGLRQRSCQSRHGAGRCGRSGEARREHADHPFVG